MSIKSLNRMQRKRFHRVHENKRYFLTQKMMAENRWEQSVYHSIINRGEEDRKDVIGVTAGTFPCSCGCGGTCHAVFSSERPEYHFSRKNIKTKRVVSYELPKV